MRSLRSTPTPDLVYRLGRARQRSLARGCPDCTEWAAGTVFPVVFRLGVSNCRNEIVVDLASFIAAKSFVWAGINRDREVEEAGRLFWHHVNDLLRPVVDPLLFLVG